MANVFNGFEQESPNLFLKIPTYKLVLIAENVRDTFWRQLYTDGKKHAPKVSNPFNYTTNLRILKFHSIVIVYYYVLSLIMLYYQILIMKLMFSGNNWKVLWKNLIGDPKQKWPNYHAVDK